MLSASVILNEAHVLAIGPHYVPVVPVERIDRTRAQSWHRFRVVLAPHVSTENIAGDVLRDVDKRLRRRDYIITPGMLIESWHTRATREYRKALFGRAFAKLPADPANQNRYALGDAEDLGEFVQGRYGQYIYGDHGTHEPERFTLTLSELTAIAQRIEELTALAQSNESVLAGGWSTPVDTDAVVRQIDEATR